MWRNFYLKIHNTRRWLKSSTSTIRVWKKCVTFAIHVSFLSSVMQLVWCLLHNVSNFFADIVTFERLAICKYNFFRFGLCEVCPGQMHHFPKTVCPVKLLFTWPDVVSRCNGNWSKICLWDVFLLVVWTYRKKQACDEIFIWRYTTHDDPCPPKMCDVCNPCFVFLSSVMQLVRCLSYNASNFFTDIVTFER